MEFISNNSTGAMPAGGAASSAQAALDPQPTSWSEPGLDAPEFNRQMYRKSPPPTQCWRREQGGIKGLCQDYRVSA